MKDIETIILSLGGSLIVPNGGIDTQFLKNFNTFIREQLTNTNRRFFIVCGGGATARHYMHAAQDVIGEVTDEDVDWLGIHATRMNAHLVRTIFRDVAHPVIVENYDRDYQITTERIVIGAGWRPGCSTDFDSVKLAERFDARTLINMSNIDHVYDKDPKHADAHALSQMTWDEYKKIVGEKWVPGMNVPFDPIATKLAAEMSLRVLILKGNPIKHLENALNGKDFVGTTIK